MTRPRLQLHLSTLLIVTVLAAELVWANAHEREEIKYFPGYGWPTIHYYSVVEPGYSSPDMKWWFLLLNGTVCLALLAVAAAAIEFVTRRRKRKPTQ